jgi:hypothetical protein
MLEDIHARVKRMDQESPFMHLVEESMSLVRSGFQWHDQTLRGKYIARHEALLRHIRRVFHPLMGRRLSISGQLGLWNGEEWREHMADYSPHCVRGVLTEVEGFVIRDIYPHYDRSSNFHYEPKSKFQYCLVLGGPDLEVTPDHPGIDLRKYDLSVGVLVPIKGLGNSGWFHQINRIVEDN